MEDRLSLQEVESAMAEFGIDGALNLHDIRFLYHFAKDVPHGGFILEVGTNIGRSSRVITAAAPAACLVTIDTSNLWDNSKGLQPKNIIRMIGTSDDISLKMIAEFDMIFIDGDHSEHGVTQDISNWLPRLKYGGVAVFHDYTNGVHPGVPAAIDAFMSVDKNYKRINPDESEKETMCSAWRKSDND